MLLPPLPSLSPSRVPQVLSAVGQVVRIELPKNPETEKTCGYCFVEYATKEQAMEAKVSCDGYKLDKKHVFIVNNMSDFQKYVDTPDTWAEPDPDVFEERENLQSWLMNSHCQDQFVVRADTDCEIHWCRKSDSVNVYSKPKWTDTYVAWSPKGSYLATFHRQGIALFGGKKWKGLQRFAHPQVGGFDFVPSLLFWWGSCNWVFR